MLRKTQTVISRWALLVLILPTGSMLNPPAIPTTHDFFSGWVDPTALLSVPIDGVESPLLSIGEHAQVQKNTG